MATVKKIHYQPPSQKLAHLCCHYGKQRGEKSPDPKEITCGICLRKMDNKTTKKPKKSEAERSKAFCFTLTPAAWNKLQTIPKSKRSRFVAQLIEKAET